MRRVMLAAVLAAFAGAGAGAGSAMAQASADIVVKPAWRTKPSGDDVIRAYPDVVTDRSISGRVVLNCTIAITGRVAGCETLSEVPYGLGFGEASERVLVAKGLFKPGTVNGKPVEMQIKVPFSIQSPSMGARYVIYEPVFAQAPSFEDMAAAWPDGADGEGAVVVLRCSLRASGSLSSCVTAGKASEGFAGAAKRLSDRFRMRLSEEEATRYANSDVLVPIRFLNPASIEARTETVKEPRWITTLRPEAVLAVYPAKAADAGVTSGRGVADCLVAPDGKLVDCRVARERPENLGFGASAVAIAPLMQMNPWTDKGRPVAGARIKLPIDFNLADDAPEK